MRGLFIGLGLFILAAVVGVAYWYKGNKKPAVTIKGIIGSEKSNFLENEKVKGILKDKYGLTLDYARAGSIEMVSQAVPADVDFLWPSSQVAAELFKSSPAASRFVKSELVFNSPIVIYSWDIVLKALTSQGIVKNDNGTNYITDMDKLIHWELSGKSWPEIGLSDLYGKINVTTTDPTKSNSGNLYAGLMANYLSGDVNNPDSVDRVIASLQQLFNRQGFMQNSSGILFEQFLQTGVGQYPMIAGYENQIVEFSLLHPDFWPKVKDKLKILYPIPTVWSEHPVLILNNKALALLDALKDPEIQRIAWEEHGFRTGLIGVQNDAKVIKVDGIAQSITRTMPMPRASIMEKIINALSADSAAKK